MLASAQITMNKKIIIILSVCLVIIIIVTVLLLARGKNTQNSSPTPQPVSPIEGVMPGIIRPTNEVKVGEIDVVAVSPADMSTDLVKTVPIEITFSKPITDKDVEFMIGPDIPFTQQIEGNKLIITPTENFKTKTLYSYRIRITNELEKVRIYTFTTAGDGLLKIPDTGPSDEQIKAYDAVVRTEHPDIYVYNNTPYSNASFSVTAAFSEATNANKFTVILKDANKNQARADFILWLQSLDMTDEQIQTLDIEYK